MSSLKPMNFESNSRTPTLGSVGDDSIGAKARSSQPHNNTTSHTSAERPLESPSEKDSEPSLPPLDSQSNFEALALPHTKDDQAKTSNPISGTAPLYHPLEKSSQDIRLLKILATGPDVPVVECELHVVSLLDKPEYTALSYVWGDPTITKEVVINGFTLSVTTNLESALRHILVHIPEDGSPRYVWADAVCIDQNNILERNHQVGLMRSIYSNAKLVVGWLGPSNDGLIRGMRGIRTIAEQAQTLQFCDLVLDIIQITVRSYSDKNFAAEIAILSQARSATLLWMRKLYRAYKQGICATTIDEEIIDCEHAEDFGRKIKLPLSFIRMGQKVVQLYSPGRYDRHSECFRHCHLEVVFLLPHIIPMVISTLLLSHNPPDTTHMLSNICSIANLLPNMRRWLEKYGSATASDFYDEEYSESKWQAIDTVADHKYFTRIWIMQEIALATSFKLICGKEFLPYSELGMACEWKFLASQQRMIIPSDRTWSNIKAVKWRALIKATSIKNIVTEFSLDEHSRQVYDIFLGLARDYDATDPRDRIYAIFGLFPLSASPNYALSVADVYKDFTKTWMSKFEDLGFLQYAGIGSTQHKGYDFSSWLPTLLPTRESKCDVFHESVYANKGFDLIETSEDKIEADILSCCGTRLAYIVETKPELPCSATIAKIRELLKEFIIRYKSCFETYITGIPPLQAFFRTILQDHCLPLSFSRLDQLDAESSKIAAWFYLLFRDGCNGDSAQNPSSTEACDLKFCNEFVYGFTTDFYPCSEITGELVAETFRYFTGSAHESITMIRSAMNRYLFTTAEGYIGLAPSQAAPGDFVCVLKSFQFPVLLRKVESHYEFVGACFVLGLMDGEAAECVRSGKAKIERFDIR